MRATNTSQKTITGALEELSAERSLFTEAVPENQMESGKGRIHQ